MYKCILDIWDGNLRSLGSIHSLIIDQMWSAALSDRGSSRGTGHGAECTWGSQTSEFISHWPVCWGAGEAYKSGLLKAFAI